MRATIQFGLALTLCTALLASGCGLKGGLYLPDDPSRQPSKSGNPDGTSQQSSGPKKQDDDKERRRDTNASPARESSVIEPPAATQTTPPDSGK